MGKYINAINGKPTGSSFTQKCNSILEAGATEVDGKSYKSDLVCVVNNGPFAAAGYAYSESEYEQFVHPCGRPKRWFVLPGAAKYAK